MSGSLPLRTAWMLAGLAALALAVLAVGTMNMVRANARALALVQAQADADILASKIASLPAGLDPDARAAEITTLITTRALAATDGGRCDSGERQRALFLAVDENGALSGGTGGVAWPGTAKPGAPLSLTVQSGVACQSAVAEAVGEIRALPGGWQVLAARTFTPDPTLVRQAYGLAGLVALAFLALAGLVGWALTRDWRLRVERLNALLDRADGRGFSERADERNGPAELRLLATHLNALLARSQNAVAALQRLHRHVAHDLRGPAMVARRLIAAAPPAPLNAEVDERLETIERRCRTLLGIIDAHGGRGGSAAALIDPLARIRELVDDMFVYLADDKDLSFAVEGETLPVALPADLFDRAIENLLGNAVKFANPGSTVRCTVAREDERCAITVVNAGPPVPENDLARIFDPGYTVGGDRAGGHGLGLALVHSVATGWGGEVRANNLPNGFSISIVLPVATAQPLHRG